MKQGCFAIILVLLCHVAWATTQDNVPGFQGIYRCKGFDPYLNKDYTGVVTISTDYTVYKLVMAYDNGETYTATGGMYDKTLLSVVFQNPKDLKQVGLEQYHYNDDYTQISGFWVYLGQTKLGKEVCTRETTTSGHVPPLSGSG